MRTKTMRTPTYLEGSTLNQLQLVRLGFCGIDMRRKTLRDSTRRLGA